jgi:DNA polymerase-3 subunit delta'
LTFQRIIGQDAPIGLLRRTLESGRVPHALLLHGPEGVGKRTVAVGYAAALLCESDGVEACGTCGECRRLGHDNHPDYFFVTRLPKPRKGAEKSGAPGRAASIDPADLRPFIVVDQIRDLAGHAVYAPSCGRHRVFVIDPADRMNDEAQNALLKTLEEPPARSVLLLVSSRPHALLTTVRSRCLSLRFGIVARPDLVRFLESRGVAAGEAVTRAALSGGSPGRALDLDLESLGRRRGEILDDLEALARSRAALSDLAGMVSRLAGRDEPTFTEGLDLCQALLRDAARSGAGLADDGLLHVDLAERLADLAGAVGPERAAELVAGIDRLRDRLRYNANRTLLTEALLAAVAGGPLP